MYVMILLGFLDGAFDFFFLPRHFEMAMLSGPHGTSHKFENPMQRRVLNQTSIQETDEPFIL